MTIPRRAIEKAIEGGWHAKENWRLAGSDDVVGEEVFLSANEGEEIDFFEITSHQIALSPDFWRALGKALGWGIEVRDGREWKVGRDGYINVWQSYAMDFYDLVLSEQPTEPFWEKLLPDKDI